MLNRSTRHSTPHWRLWCAAAAMMLGFGAAQAHARCLQEQKLTASDAAEHDRLGRSVSVCGDIAIVGAPGDDAGETDSGSAYIFRLEGTRWVEEQKLTPPDAALNKHFGNSVSVSGDTVVVGAVFDTAGGTSTGSAYVLRFDGVNWVEEQELTASDASQQDNFGFSVSISGDTAIVGALGNDEGATNSGAAYVFRFDGTSWAQEQKLKAIDAGYNHRFGRSVSINGDIAIVGGHGDDHAGPSSGSAYIFRFDGTSWVEEQKLMASDAARADYFGSSVSGSGDTVVVGAWGDDDTANVSGSAYIFRFDGMSWVEEQKLTASDASRYNRFGYSVSVSGDIAIVGTLNDTGLASGGSAYFFQFDGTSWVEEWKLSASESELGDFFGRSVSVSGETVVVGATGVDDAGSGSGSAYMFSCSPPPTVVSLDIKPGSCPNPVNRKSRGSIPVAVVGSLDFDVTTVDPYSLRLSRSDGVGESISVSLGPHGPWTRIDDVTSALGDEPCSCHDSNGDGIDDLLLKFSASELTIAFRLDELPQRQSIELLLEGALADGTDFEGVDCIEVLGARRETRAKRHKKRTK